MLPITCTPRHTNAAISVVDIKCARAEQRGNLGFRRPGRTPRLKSSLSYPDAHTGQITQF